MLKDAEKGVRMSSPKVPQGKTAARRVRVILNRPQGKAGRNSIFDVEVKGVGLVAQVVDTNEPAGRVAGNGHHSARIQPIISLATDVFGSENVAKVWLRTPNLATNGVAPRSLLATESGGRLVENLLHRIEYGVLA